MLTRRKLLIGAAISPIAQFCRTEPQSAVAGLSLAGNSVQFFHEELAAKWIARIEESKSSVELRFALPPGTLG